MNMVSDRLRAPGSVTATICATSQKCALVIQPLVPVITHSSPSRSARVLIDSTSDPTPGSVFANAQVISARISGSRKRCFPDSLRCTRFGLGPSVHASAARPSPSPPRR